MGRTLATFSQLIDQEIAAWQNFRRALRKEDQAHLDALFRAAKYHVAAASFASKASPIETMVLAMLIESYKKNALLEARVIKLEASLQGKERSDEAHRLDL